jgi:hypothetical protein
MLRRYRWLFGIYDVAMGAGFSLLGWDFGKNNRARMFSGIDGFFPEETVFAGGAQFGFNEGFSNLLRNNPISIFRTAMIILGVLLIITGVILAVALRRCFSLKSE